MKESHISHHNVFVKDRKAHVFDPECIMIEKLPNLEDDGLLSPEIGAWAEYKYRLVWNYATMFATSMKDKWDARVYIDLFAGAGRAKIENTSQIVPASPLLALDIPHS